MSDSILDTLVLGVLRLCGMADPPPQLVSALKSLVLSILGLISALAGGYQMGVFSPAPYIGVVPEGIVGQAWAGGALASVLASFAINLLLKLLSGGK